jgi:hypothetical protein
MPHTCRSATPCSDSPVAYDALGGGDGSAGRPNEAPRCDMDVVAELNGSVTCSPPKPAAAAIALVPPPRLSRPGGSGTALDEPSPFQAGAADVVCAALGSALVPKPPYEAEDGRTTPGGAPPNDAGESASSSTAPAPLASPLECAAPADSAVLGGCVDSTWYPSGCSDLQRPLLATSTNRQYSVHTSTNANEGTETVNRPQAMREAPAG